jgi:hypothetical protein
MNRDDQEEEDDDEEDEDEMVPFVNSPIKYNNRSFKKLDKLPYNKNHKNLKIRKKNLNSISMSIP